MEECKTAAQLKGTLMPISKAAPTLEKVAITQAMKVRGGEAMRVVCSKECLQPGPPPPPPLPHACLAMTHAHPLDPLMGCSSQGMCSTHSTRHSYAWPHMSHLSAPPPLLPLQDAPAYAKLRVERMNLRMTGVRAKRAKDAEAAEKDS